MKKPIIAVDVDEVLFPFLDEFIKFHNSRYHTNLSFDQFMTYRFEDTMGLSQEEAIARVYAFHEVDDLHVEPLAEAQRALRKLSERYQLVVVTARHNRFEPGTRAWINKNFADVFSDVVMVGLPSTMEVYRSKAEVCKELGVMALIDDSVRHITECLEVGVQGILFGDYAWTQRTVPEGAVRCKDWAEVLEYFDGQA